jgi:hypothetical protein
MKKQQDEGKRSTRSRGTKTPIAEEDEKDEYMPDDEDMEHEMQAMDDMTEDPDLD